MPDFSQVPHVVHHVAAHAHVVKPLVQQVAQYPVVQPVVQTIQTGVSYMDSFLIALSTFLVGCGMGWYVKGRGLTGVQIDLDNVKTDVSNLKNKVISLVPSETVKAPVITSVAGSKVTPAITVTTPAHI